MRRHAAAVAAVVMGIATLAVPATAAGAVQESWTAQDGLRRGVVLGVTAVPSGEALVHVGRRGEVLGSWVDAAGEATDVGVLGGLRENVRVVASGRREVSVFWRERLDDGRDQVHVQTVRRGRLGTGQAIGRPSGTAAALFVGASLGGARVAASDGAKVLVQAAGDRWRALPAIPTSVRILSATVDDAGTATLVAAALPGSGRGVAAYTSRPDRSGWDEEWIAPREGEQMSSPERGVVATGGDGGVVVVYAEDDGATLVAVSRSDPAASWTVAELATGRTCDDLPSPCATAGMDADGGAWAMWTAASSGEGVDVQLARLDAETSTWSQSVTALTSSVDPFESRGETRTLLSVAPTGEAVVTYPLAPPDLGMATVVCAGAAPTCELHRDLDGPRSSISTPVVRVAALPGGGAIAAYTPQTGARPNRTFSQRLPSAA